MKKTIVIMIGIQGSGKSTFCQNFLADYKRINLDTLKTRHQEQLAINECFVTGENFVIDNTNPTKEERKKYIIQAKKEDYRIVGYFMESKIKECIERNNKRDGKARIPTKAIAATSNKLQLPEYDEGFDELHFVRNTGNIMLVEDWRQEDAHRNALNAHCYWILRKEGESVESATSLLEGKSVSYKNELLFSKGINFDKLPSWQKRGVGIYWNEIEKTGYNPIKDSEEKTVRRELKVDIELELGEKYATMIEKIVG